MDLTETFTWEGRRIAWGRDGSGPDVVFCHGTPFSSRVWSPYADALRDRFTVHLWDMPGYGESSKEPDHPVDFASQGRAFAALLEHWELAAPHVVAHDFGGSAALRALLVEGATYASLALVDVVAVPPAGSPFFRFVEKYAEAMDELPAYVHEAVLRTYIGGASHRGLRDGDLAELVAPWIGESGQRAFYRQIADYDERWLADNERRLPRIDIPVQVVWGEDDGWVRIEIGRRVHALIPRARWRQVPGAGHLVQYDAPVALATTLTSWLGEQSG